MLELFLTEDDIPRLDLKAATGLGDDALSNRIGKLRKHHLIQSGRQGYRKTPRFVDLLRRWALGRCTASGTEGRSPEVRPPGSDAARRGP
jgi:hypothetical protein